MSVLSCTEEDRKVDHVLSEQLSEINLTKTQTFGDTQDVLFDRMGLVDDGEMLVGMADPPVPNDPERAIFYYRLDFEGNLAQQERVFEQNAITIFKTKANSFSVTMQ